MGTNSGVVAASGTSLRFDGNVTLGNGNTATSLTGTSLLNGVAFSGFDGLTFGSIQLATAGSSLNSNGSAIQVSTLSGAQNLILAPGIAAGGTDFLGAVSNLGSGIGAALTVSDGVTGQVHFGSTLGTNSGVTAAFGTNLRFDGNVTLGDGDTASSLGGSVVLDGLTLDAFDGITANAVTLSSGAVSIQSTAGKITLGTVDGAEQLNLDSGPANDSLVLGPVGGSLAPTGLTINNAATAYFYDKVTVNGGIQINNATNNVAFAGDLSANSINSSASANDYSVTMTGSTTIVIGATFLANTGSVVIGNSPADIFLFGGGLDVNSLTLGYSTSIAGFISSSATAIHLDRTLLSADATIDTTNGGTAPLGSPLSLTNGIVLNGNTLTTRTGLFSPTTISGNAILSAGQMVAEFGDLNLGTSMAGANITLTGDMLVQAKAGNLTVGPLTTIAGGTSNLTLQADDLFILSSPGSIVSSGNVVLAPTSVSRGIFLGTAAGSPSPGLKVSQAMINAIDAGGLVIGQSGDSGAVTIGTTTVANPLTVYANGGGGKVLLTGPLASMASTGPGVTILGSGTTTVLGANIITAGTAVVINDSVQVDANVTIDTTASGTVPGGADINITGGAAGIYATSGKSYGLTMQGGSAGVATLGALKGFGNGGIGSLVTGLTANAGSIILPTTNTLDGAVSLAATAISVGADLTAGAGLSITGALDLTGSSILTGDGVTVTGGINGGNNNLTFDGMSGIATSGPIVVTGTISNVANLSVQDSTGATFSGAVTAQSAQANGANTGTISFNNNLNLAGGFTAAPGAYAVSILGASNTLGGPVSFGNTNPLVIGNDNSDSTTIGSGLARLTQTNLQGAVILGGPSTLGLVNSTNPAGNLNITADSLNIGYNNAGNTFGALSITSPNAVNVTAGALASTTLTISSGSLAESGGTFLVAGATNITTTGTLNLPGANSFGGDITFSGTTVTINDSTLLTLAGTSTATGNLALSSPLGINQTGGSVLVSGNSTLTSPGSNIIMNSATNNFTGTVAATGASITLRDTNAIKLGPITASGTLGITAGGIISQSDILTVTGATTLSAPIVGGDISLGLANALNGGVTFTGAAVVLNDAGSLNLNGPCLGTGNATISATGVLTDSAGLISIGGTSNFSGFNIALTNLNAAGQVSANTPGGATLLNTPGLNLGASSISGPLTAYSLTGDITDAGLVSVGGDAQFTTYTIDAKILLDQSIVTGTVSFSTQGTAGDVLYGTAAPITLGGGIVSGGLTLNTGSTIGQAALFQVYGSSSITGSDITLNNPGNVMLDAVNFTGRNVSLAAGNAVLQVGPGTATGGLNLAGISITQSGKLTVLGATSVSATGNINLSDSTNSLASPVAVSSAGNTILNAGNALMLANSSIGGSFQSSSLGIDQVLGATLFVGGPSTIDVTAAADILLDNAGNDFGGAVGFTAQNVNLKDANAIILGPGDASGTLAVLANGIGQGGALSVTGASTFTSPGGDVSLGNPLNALTGEVSFTGKNVQVSDALALMIASGTASGTMDLLGAKIGQASPVSATGASTLTATAGDIVFLLANSLGGTLGFSGSNVSLNNILATALGTGSATGSFTLTSGGAVTQGTGALGINGPSSVTATGADITLGGPANALAGGIIFHGKNVSISNTLDLAMAGTATGNLSVDASGDITDTGPVSAGGTASFNATGAGNGILVDQLSAMGLITANTTDGDAAVANSSAISFAGNVTGQYGLTAMAGGISDGGPVSATEGLVLAAPGASMLSQALAGKGGLTFDGTGTLTVSGINTFTGDTLLNDGTLILTGSLGSSPVTVVGGSFRGSGDMASLTATGGTVRPGQSAGTFTSAGAADLGAGNQFVVEINGSAAGTGYSQVIADGVALGATLELAQTSVFTPMIGSHFTIIDNTGTLPVTGTFAGLPEGSVVPLGALRFVISYIGGSGNDVVLTAINNVPTPSGGVVTAPFSLAPGNLVTAVSGGFVQFSTSAGINRQFKPFPGYNGLLAVNAMDRTGDGTADSLVVAVATPGNMPRLMVIDAATGRVAQNGYAFTPEFLGGMSVSSGMANLGGINTSVLIVGAGPGANPLVRVFNSVNSALIKQFNAFSATYSGGVHVAMSNPDGMGDSIAVVSARTGSRVSGFDLDNPSVLVANFNAFTSMMNGVTVSVGDVDGDGSNEIVVGSGSGASPLVRIYTSSGVFIRQFQPFATSFTGGVNVGLADFDADGQLEFVTAAASGTKGRLIIYKGDPVSVIHSAFMTTGISELAAATNLTVVA